MQPLIARLLGSGTQDSHWANRVRTPHRTATGEPQGDRLLLAVTGPTTETVMYSVFTGVTDVQCVYWCDLCTVCVLV